MSTPPPQENSSTQSRPLLIGALLRVPAQAIHRRIVAGLNAAGYTDLTLPHIAVFLYPGPDGVRPTTLADRAGMSKQAMNQLLRSLEAAGYITRSDSADEGRARLIRLTKRGHAAYAKIVGILRGLEREWQSELGPKDFALLKQLLARVFDSPLVR